MKKFPWFSLLLLFAAYTTFSWFLIHATAPPLAWIGVLSFTVIQSLLLTTWFDSLKRFVRLWLRSDIGYFTLIMVFALGSTGILVWFKTFGYFLVLIAAEVLTRLELQNAGFTRIQALFLLTLFSLAGLATGWAASENPLFRPTIS
ncbi:MAG: hypothetical protein MUF72_14065 [Elainella sp. Prado103]|nr:hypothetical protein [Elainella sp. Prado103]